MPKLKENLETLSLEKLKVMRRAKRHQIARRLKNNPIGDTAALEASAARVQRTIEHRQKENFMAVTRKPREYTDRRNLNRAIKDAGIPAEIPFSIVQEWKNRHPKRSGWIFRPVFKPRNPAEREALQKLGFQTDKGY